MMNYLDNGATSFPKAPGVAEAMTKFLANDAANPGRSGHKMAKNAEAMLERVRLKLCRFVNGPSPERVAFTLNCTDALNIAINGVLRGPTIAAAKRIAKEGGNRPHVITTVLEHNSVSRPLEAFAARGLIDLTRVGCDADGFVSPAEIERNLRPETLLVVMTHASNVIGTVQDAAAVGAACRKHGAIFCLDVAQTIGAVPVDMKALNADILVFPGHKSLLGPTGTGAIILGERCPSPSEEVDDHTRFWSWREGGTGGDSKTPVQPAQMPYALEGGTPNTVGIAGLEAGIDYVVKQGSDKLIAHERALCSRLLSRLGADERFRVLGTLDASRRVGVVSITVRGFENPYDVGMILDDSFNIAVRPGLHCAPYAHQAMGTFPDGTLRISPGAFNTEADIDAILEALDQIAM